MDERTSKAIQELKAEQYRLAAQLMALETIVTETLHHGLHTGKFTRDDIEAILRQAVSTTEQVVAKMEGNSIMDVQASRAITIIETIMRAFSVDR